MTRDQFNRLLKYEQIFRIAITAQYIRGMLSRFAADMIDICRELNIYVKPGCPSCMLKAAITLGKIYFDFKDKLDSADLVDYSDIVVLSVKAVEGDAVKTDSKAVLASSGTTKRRTNKNNKKK